MYERHRPYENATPVRTITAGHGRMRVSSGVPARTFVE